MDEHAELVFPWHLRIPHVLGRRRNAIPYLRVVYNLTAGFKRLETTTQADGDGVYIIVWKPVDLAS